jgi:hypothetical protein
MTPLAQELVEDLHSRIHIRREAGAGETEASYKQLRGLLLTMVRECKFFDCTEVMPLAFSLGEKIYAAFEEFDRIDQRLAFLPAEWTWVEAADARPQATYRAAHVFYAEHGVTVIAHRFLVTYETPRPKNKPRVWIVVKHEPLPLVHSGLRPQRYKADAFTGDICISKAQLAAAADNHGRSNAVDFLHYALLALINTPRVIGQRMHYPHQRLEREKLARLKLVGKFPLRAWTEIILKVAPPDDRSGEPSQEGHLTGERCLHFCRTYLRVRLGMLEYVDAHWRGNPALGMKQSRYRLELEKPK